eukprot:3329194-Prymnesium_polylepis.1
MSFPATSELEGSTTYSTKMVLESEPEKEYGSSTRWRPDEMKLGDVELVQNSAWIDHEGTR